MAHFEYCGRTFVTDTSYVLHRAVDVLMGLYIEGTPVEGGAALNRSLEREFPGRYEVTGTYDSKTRLAGVRLFDKEKGEEIFSATRNFGYKSDIDHAHLMSVIDNL